MDIEPRHDLKKENARLHKELDSTRDLLESANSIIIRWSRDGFIRYINNFGLRFFGYSSAEIIGQPIMRLLPETETTTGRDLSDLANEIANNPDQHISVQNENMTKDGRIVWVAWTNKGVFDENGNVLEILTIGNDITAIKAAEQAKSENQGKLHAALESMGDAVFISDNQGTFIHMNNAFATFHKFKDKSECLANLEDYPKILDVFLPDGEPLPLNQWLVPRALRGESGTNAEYTLLRKDTGETWMGSYNFGPFFDQQGNIAGSVVVARDITEKKRSEKKIQQSEEKFRTLAELSHFGIFLADTEGKAIYVNPQCAEIVGVPAEQALDLDWAHYLHPDDKERVFGTWMHAVHNKESFQQEYRYIHSDGQVVWTQCKASPVIDSDGEVALFTGSMIDFTELEEAKIEQELLTKQLESLWKISSLKNADLKTICDTILVEITQLTDSPYGFYGFINEAETAMSIYSWSKETMADCAIHDKALIFKIDQSGIWGNAVRDRKPFLLNDYRETCANKKGLPQGHVDLTRALSVPVFDNDKIVALAAVANKPADYTRQDLKLLDGFLSNVQILINQKKAEEERFELEKQLQQAKKIEAIGQLAGGVAHDFNNMLGVILGHTELALLKTEPDNPFVKDLEQIQVAAKRSADLTRQLLTFARKETIAPQILDLNEAVAEMLSLLQRLIRETVKLSWNPGVNLWPVKVDPAQLNQILTNLCINARDAIGGVGTITITTENCSLAEGDIMAIPTLPPGDYVCLSVADDGHGIDRADQKKIFEPFYTSKELGQGTGLGLSTVYGAVKQNRGFIDVASEPGQGATFHIYLPRQQKSFEPAGKASSQPLCQAEGTILVVEDDQMLLDMTKAMLETFGYKVLAAQTSDRAISLVKTYPEPIDLLLSDVVMPTMNGKDLRDTLHQIRPEMKVIFMSGYTADIIAQQGVLEEATHFLQKPLTYEKLISKVQDVIGKG